MITEIKPTIVFLMGPTAAGKTDLAIQLAHFGDYEIISVDSAMVYRGMNIGTGKPSPQILSETKHHLIDICDPEIPYSAANFCRDAHPIMKSILSRGKIPLLVGGTMLYFKALQEGLAQLPHANIEVRNRLSQLLLQEGNIKLHQRLMESDPRSAQRIHPNDSQRLLRALEVFELTKLSMSAHFNLTQNSVFPYDVMAIAIAPSDRKILHHAIEQRFLRMLKDGFIKEVESFFAQNNMHPDLPSMRAVGYRQVWQYLAGNLDYDQMVEKAVAATRQFAKRQFTWLRRWENLNWFSNEEVKLAFKLDRLIKKL